MAKLKTFQATPEDTKFSLKTKNIAAAQNVKCINCGEMWWQHFAGISNSIPQGACLAELDVVYS